MTKRTEFKKRNIELFLKRNVFSGKYVVKNTLILSIVACAVAGVVGITDVIMQSLETRPEVTIAEETRVSAYGNIEMSEVPQLQGETIGRLYAGLDMNETFDLASRDRVLVSNAPGQFDTKCVVTADEIMIYENTSEDSAVLGMASTGAVAEVIANDGEWTLVESGKVRGYIKSQYILTGDAAGEYASKYYRMTAIVKEDGVRVRSTASKDSVYLAIVNEGERYEVLQAPTAASNWAKVRIDNKTEGYIFGDLLAVNGTYPKIVSAEDMPKVVGSITECTVEEVEEKPITETGRGQITVPYTPRNPVSLSEEDLNLMAKIVSCESRGESYEGKLAVANIILNRLESGEYGDSIYDVVFSKNQFSCTFDGSFENTGINAECMEACRNACDGINNIGTFDCFLTTEIAKYNDYRRYTVIGNHVFY